jgi:hypothetical protein
MENTVRSGPFWDMIEGRSPLPAASRLLGWKLLTLDPAKGAIRVEFAAVPDFINPIGTIQGGIITAMLDDAMGPAATAFLGGHYVAPTVEIKTNFMRPALVTALQTTDAYQVSTPEGWQPGDKVIVPPPATTDAAEARMQEGYDCTAWFFCTKALAAS